MKFRTNRDDARRSVPALEKSGRERHERANTSLVQHVPDGEGQSFGNAEAQEKLRADQRPVARVKPATVTDEKSLFPRGK